MDLPREILQKENKMLNIEKYKDVIPNMRQANIACCVRSLIKGKCIANCKECKKEALEWLTEEYKEPILDKAEKEYLSAIIEPFIDMVEYIYKGIRYKNDYVIRIDLKSDKSEIYTKSISFPLLEGELMFKGMELNKHYSLEELGL